MKGFGFMICCLTLCFYCTACSGQATFKGNYYNNYEAGGQGNNYEISGDAYVKDALSILYFTPSENTSLDLKGELKSVSSDVQIVYVNSSGGEVVVSDGSGVEKKSLKIDTSIPLSQGEGYLEFRGDHISFQFDLLFQNIEKDKYDYFDVEYDTGA